MEPLTPQIAKLIVMKLSLASAEKLRNQSISDTDRLILKAAIENNINDIKGHIRYQSRICGEAN